MTLQDAVNADVVIRAVPFRARPAVAASARDWTGKVVIDAMNTCGVPIEELKCCRSTDVVADASPSAKVVKTLNQLPAKLLAVDPVANGGRRVMFVASNDDAAAASVGNWWLTSASRRFNQGASTRAAR